jgi:hypothetical protein
MDVGKAKKASDKFAGLFMGRFKYRRPKYCLVSTNIRICLIKSEGNITITITI